jgi:hypothetical protein
MDGGAMSTLLAVALLVGALRALLYVIWLLARPHRAMYEEIAARCAALNTSVPDPSVDGTATAGAGTPDSAPVVARRRVGWWSGSAPAHRRVA